MDALENGIISLIPQNWEEMHEFSCIDKLKRYSPCTCEKGVGASQVSEELLPVWVVAGRATLFLMMKSTTASKENYKHTSRGHPQEEKLFRFGPNNSFWTSRAFKTFFTVFIVLDIILGSYDDIQSIFSLYRAVNKHKQWNRFPTHGRMTLLSYPFTGFEGQKKSKLNEDGALLVSLTDSVIVCFHFQISDLDYLH